MVDELFDHRPLVVGDLAADGEHRLEVFGHAPGRAWRRSARRPRSAAMSAIVRPSSRECSSSPASRPRRSRPRRTASQPIDGSASSAARRARVAGSRSRASALGHRAGQDLPPRRVLVEDERRVEREVHALGVEHQHRIDSAALVRCASSATARLRRHPSGDAGKYTDHVAVHGLGRHLGHRQQQFGIVVVDAVDVPKVRGKISMAPAEKSPEHGRRGPRARRGWRGCTAPACPRGRGAARAATSTARSRPRPAIRRIKSHIAAISSRRGDSLRGGLAHHEAPHGRMAGVGRDVDADAAVEPVEEVGHRPAGERHAGGERVLGHPFDAAQHASAARHVRRLGRAPGRSRSCR